MDMEEKRPTCRRWFQFSLRTFLLVAMLVGLGGAWVGMQLQQKRRHESVVNTILKAGGAVDFSDTGELPAWKEWLYGSYAVKPVKLTLSKQPQGHAFAWIGVAFEPEKLHWEDGVNSDSILSQTQGMNLIDLNLDLSNVTDAGLSQLQGMTDLEQLSLMNTQITDAGLTHLKGLNRLKSLHLSNAQITDAGLRHLNGLTTLKFLSLDNTQITDAGLTHLKGLVRLEYLDLGSNQITDADVVRLEREFPYVFIDNFSSE